jgi:hypothetical protein
MCKFWFIIAIFWVGVCGSVQAQERGKFQKNLQIKGKKNPPVRLPQKPKEIPDTLSEKETFWFDPQKKQHSIVEEDTLMIDEGGEPEIVEVREEIRVDSVWLTAAKYYSTWDTRNIDPYQKNPAEFRDTVELHLYDPDHNWAFPLVHSHVTSPFAYRWYRWHYGTDLALNTGDSVRAAFDGIARIVRWDGGGYGFYVVLRHLNGIETLYGHLSRQLVEAGQYVHAGDLIGWGGSTGHSSGPHLHYETRYQGDAFNPAFIYDFAHAGQIKGEYFTLTREQFSYVGNVRPMQQAYFTRRAVYHRIRNGETLGLIARKYRTTIGMLCRLNGISTRTLIRAGRNLRVR